jgi:hypothetical protein
MKNKKTIKSTKKIRIFLENKEIEKCIEMAKKRNSQSRLMGLKHKYGMQEKDGLAMDVIGCKGEYAVIKYLGIKQEITINTFKNIPDVGNYEVRSVTKPGYRLIIREKDDKEKIYILVEVGFNYCDIIGYTTGKEALKYNKENQAGREPAWFIPQEDLKPVTDLKSENPV